MARDAARLDAIRLGENGAAKLPRRTREDLRMATYIVLGNYTDQGVRTIKDAPKRTEAVKEMAKKTGVVLKETFWTLGAYDFVSIIESPDDQTTLAFGMSVGALGNVRTQTLRAFTGADMGAILGKMM
jgi:uncharacterized protein with GYD domain